MSETRKAVDTGTGSTTSTVLYLYHTPVLVHPYDKGFNKDFRKI
jgi:hypothetical protein